MLGMLLKEKRKMSLQDEIIKTNNYSYLDNQIPQNQHHNFHIIRQQNYQNNYIHQFQLSHQNILLDLGYMLDKLDF